MISPKSCLIVDDSQMIRSLERELMAKAGCKDIHIAADGEKALELFKARLAEGKSFELNLCDLEMPNLDGAGFLKQAKELMGPDQNVVIIVVTSVKDPDHVKEVVALGVDGYLLKPFTPEDFNKKLQQIMARRFPNR